MPTPEISPAGNLRVELARMIGQLAVIETRADHTKAAPVWVLDAIQRARVALIDSLGGIAG